MDIDVLDKRLRAFEKKFRNLELLVRSDAARPWRWALAALALVPVVLAGAYSAYQFYNLANARVTRVDESLARDFPSYDSPYCRWIYGEAPGYDDCLRHEQSDFARFETAWHNGKTVPDVREQMIRCFATAQNEPGVSWRIAAECAELDDDAPETGKAR